MKKKTTLILLSFLLFLTAGCATAPKAPDALAVYQEINDPLEPMNRKIHAFNMAADKYALRPLMNGYRAVTTRGFRKKVVTFLANLKTPLTVVNDVLQLNFKNAGKDLSRFIINSTLGFMGVFDVADRMGIAPNFQGLANTLAVWGIPSGPYLVLPLLGPSSVRDFTGFVGSYYLDPFTYVIDRNNTDDVKHTVLGIQIAEGVTAYESAIDLMDDGRKTSLDFYAYMRSAYRQFRKKQIEDAKGITTKKDTAAAYEFSLDDEFDE